jgi:hypothetical protein
MVWKVAMNSANTPATATVGKKKVKPKKIAKDKMAGGAPEW